jgi:hypothetical protein
MSVEVRLESGPSLKRLVPMRGENDTTGAGGHGALLVLPNSNDQPLPLFLLTNWMPWRNLDRMVD